MSDGDGWYSVLCFALMVVILSYIHDRLRRYIRDRLDRIEEKIDKLSGK